MKTKTMTNRMLLRPLGTMTAGLLILAFAAPAAQAEASTSDTVPVTVSGEAAAGHTVLALMHPTDFPHHHPTRRSPNRRPPARRYVPRRPPVRRVYRAPRHATRPRRDVESVYRPRMHFGLGINGLSVADDDTNLGSGIDTGGGFELSFGVRISPAFSLDINGMVSFHDDMDGNEAMSIGALTLDGRFFLTDWDQRMQPYLQVGIGGYALTRDRFSDEALTGAGFQLGGGVDIYLTQSISIGGKVLYRGAFVDNADDFRRPFEEAFLSMVSYGGDVKFHF
ncbi:MAG: opacity protein-like surface antigen [Myxococcota bacterium]|jgi:opacity protein-like surface antigen